MKTKIILLALLVCFWIFCTQTQASPVTIQISGVVTDVRDLEDYPYSDTIHVGVTFTGTYTYDSATIDTSTHTGMGCYVHNSPYGFNISIAGFEFRTAENHVGQFDISILNDYSLQPYDAYWVTSNQNELLSTGLSVNSIIWHLSDNKHTALSSTALQSDAPNISEGIWSSNTFSIGCGGIPGGNATFAIWGTVTQAVLVPEPLTMTLMTMGIFFLRRRR